MLDHSFREAADHRVVPFLHFDPQCLDLGAQPRTFGRGDSFGGSPLRFFATALSSEFLLAPRVVPRQRSAVGPGRDCGKLVMSVFRSVV
jgi:hypothetical protein